MFRFDSTTPSSFRLLLNVCTCTDPHVPPTKPAPYSHMVLTEADLIDYTPAIKDSALKLAKPAPQAYKLPETVPDQPWKKNKQEG